MTPVPAPPRSGIGAHYLRYLGSNVLVVAAGFISFPALARLLDNHQFGLLGYYEAWLLLIAGTLKLGAQHTILRFYPHGASAEQLRVFRSDQVLLPFGLSLLLWLCCVAAVIAFSQYLPRSEWPIIAVLLLTIPLLIWSSLVEAVMYALERSDISLWLKTTWRWSELALVLITIGFIERAAVGVLAAKLAVLIVVALWLTLWFRRWMVAPVAPPGRTQVLAGLAFGLPMMFNELSSVLFGFADRIMLRGLTGSLHDVGVYTIGYGLAMAVGTIVGVTLNQAFTPTAVRRFETSGPAAVLALKRQMLDLWILAVSLASALLLCVGDAFLVVLAGSAKAASAPVFVIVASTLVWYSLFEIGQYGLLLQRRASRYLLITLLATGFNLALNIPLIQRFGVLGAAWATTASYALLAWLQYRQCPPELRYLPPPARFAMALAFPAVLYVSLRTAGLYEVESAVWRLLIGAPAVLLPAALLLAADATLRRSLARLLRQYRARVRAP